MAEIASAYVSLMPSAKGFGKKLQGEVGGDVTSAGKKLGSTFGKVFTAGAGLLAAAGVGSFLKDSIGEAREAQKVGALTESIIKSTGGAAKVTAEQVGDLAGAISAKTGMDDEAIQSGANLLLTFKNVRNEVGAGADIFNRATAAAADLSAAGFGDLNGQAKMLGKALNDPIKGISALSRSGVTFTAQQQEQIKAMVASGKTLKAQQIIMREVESQVGGAAEATATAGEKASVAFGNLQEQVGTALLPVIDRLAATFTTTVAPALSNFVAGIQNGTGAGGRLAAIVLGLGSTVASAALFINQNRTAVTALAAAFGALIIVTRAHAAVLAVSAAGGLVKYLASTRLVTAATKTWTAVQWLLNAALRANPIGIVITVVAALGVALVAAYKKSDTFRKMISGAFKGIVTAAKSFGASVAAAVSGAFDKIRAAGAAIVGWFKGNWKAIAILISGPWAPAVALVVLNLDKIIAAGKKVVAWFQGLPGSIKGAFGSAGSLLSGIGKAIIDGFLGGLRSAWDAGKGFISGIGGWIKDNKGPIEKDRVLLVPAGLAIMQGLVRGLKDGQPKLDKSLLGITQMLEGVATPLVKQAEKWGEKLGEALGEALGVKGLGKKLKTAGTALRKQVVALGRGLSKELEKAISFRDQYDSIKSGVADAFKGDWFSAAGQEAEFDANGVLVKPATTAMQEFFASITGNKSMLGGVLDAFRALKGIPGMSKDFLLDLFNSGNSELVLGLAGDPAAAAEANRLFTSTTALANELGASVADDRLGAGIYAVRDEISAMRRELRGLAPEFGKVINGASSAAARAKKAKAKKGGKK